MARVRRSRSRRAKRALPLAFRVAAIYAMLVAATLLVVAGLALQFTRSQVTGYIVGTHRPLGGAADIGAYECF